MVQSFFTVPKFQETDFSISEDENSITIDVESTASNFESGIALVYDFSEALLANRSFSLLDLPITLTDIATDLTARIEITFSVGIFSDCGDQEIVWSAPIVVIYEEECECNVITVKRV